VPGTSSDGSQSTVTDYRLLHLRERMDGYLASYLPSIEPYTPQEYFTLLLSRAIRACAAGDYGIAAAWVIRCNDVELISLGWNTIYSAKDVLGHAEVNAIRTLRLLLGSLPVQPSNDVTSWTTLEAALKSRDAVFYRPCPPVPNLPHSLFLTTLEPCPMCTVAIINAGINRVIIAESDEKAGTLLPDHLATLPPVWRDIVASQGLRVRLTGQIPSAGSPSLPNELAGLLHDAFLLNRKALDDRLKNGGLMPLSEICELLSLQDPRKGM
jgi:tRNA(Arg) A34 adenosine deaminase TadA